MLNQKDNMNKHHEFMTLYEPVHQSISNYCRAICRNNDSAKDLLSETLLIAYQKMESLRNREAFKYFLFGIASRLYKKWLLRKKFQAEYDEESTAAIPCRSAETDYKTDVGILYEGLAKLSTEQAEALILFEINGFSIKEISQIQKASLSAVKSRLTRGREKLRRIFETDYRILHEANEKEVSYE